MWCSLHGNKRSKDIITFQHSPYVFLCKQFVTSLPKHCNVTAHYSSTEHLHIATLVVTPHTFWHLIGTLTRSCHPSLDASMACNAIAHKPSMSIANVTWYALYTEQLTLAIQTQLQTLTFRLSLYEWRVLFSAVTLARPSDAVPESHSQCPARTVLTACPYKGVTYR